ncbi:hypothetical protein [Enterococcus sp. 2201sp1_2201st1_B8_2201SCRN_220225]|uniref:hypothetical protein n=1 Tax=unclassified Enterococcus TaxID=2608891 RepID=UPI0034A5B777
MKVRKENRILTVDETDKAFYLGEGYDVVELDEKSKTYKVVEAATGGRTYSVAEYNALKAENDALVAKVADLTAQLEVVKSTDMSRDEIKAALTEKGVEFKGNASKEDLKKLLEDSK